jgi:hypothetical protein
VGGVALLLVTASVDYRLLEIAQHPFAVLTPLVLVLAAAGMVITLRLGQLPEGTTQPAALFPSSDLFPVLVGVVLILAVWIADRLWIAELDLVLYTGCAGRAGAGCGGDCAVCPAARRGRRSSGSRRSIEGRSPT